MYLSTVVSNDIEIVCIFIYAFLCRQKGHSQVAPVLVPLYRLWSGFVCINCLSFLTTLFTQNETANRKALFGFSYYQ